MPIDPFSLLTGKLSDQPYPGGISQPGGGGKFTPDGTVLEWPGNTFICPVPQNSDSFAAMVDIQNELKQSEFAPCFTFLPTSSFHMTVFQGLSPGNEGTKDWPANLPGATDYNAATEAMLKRIAPLTLDNQFGVSVTDLFCGYSLALSGADEASERTLRQNRIQLRDATQISPPAFDDYVFHITLAYMLSWLSESHAKDLLAFSRSLFSRYEDRLQNIELAPCVFCDFKDMHAFTPIE